MLLPSGTKLGPYEILAPLGAGGMGEVYKARDTRLDRVVAVKVSNEQFSERSEREARAIAQLNHPNICQLYDVGPNYLVMELIHGAPLKGPLPLNQVLKYAAQICDALDAAHRKGITHRDLKPANILVTKTGIKLLDFGLAKIAQAAEPLDDATLAMALTGKNEIVGTLYYMSPEQLQEQATGQEIDARSDIFSFGLVLYEMLTGKRAFDGASPASVIAAIMERPAPSISGVAPPALDRVLKKCLAKDPDERWQTARDLKDELDWIASSSGDAPADTVSSQSRFGSAAWIAAAVLAVVAGGSSFIAYRATRPVEHPLMRFTDEQDAEISIAAQEGPALAISPDGSRLAFVSQGTEQTTHISVRMLESPKSTALDGTEGAAAPFFSADGQWIGFFTGNTLKKISVQGGAPVILCEVGGPPRGGGFWGEDGNVYFASQQTPVMRVSANGGTPTAATELNQQKGEVSNRGAQLLPGGEALLFDAAKDNNVWENESSIEVQSLKSGQRKTLIQGGYFGHYIHGSNPSRGHLIYTHGGTLFAAPMDLKRLELTGPALPVLEGMAGRSANGFAHLGFTASGSMVYVEGLNLSSQLSLFWLDAAGNTQSLPAAPREYVFPRVSPDGTRIAVLAADESGLYLAAYEWAQNRMTKLTFWKGVSGARPAWAPDGKHIVFLLTSPDLAGPGIYWIRSDGAGEPQRLIEGQSVVPDSFSPDGKHLVYVKTALPDHEIWTVPLDLADPEHPKVGKPELFLTSKFDLRGVSFSPDGRWIAYRSAESGQPEIFVRPFPGPGGKWQVSAEGGTSPIWSRNGRELFYQGRDMMVAPYSVKGDSFTAGQPRPWSEKTLPMGNYFDLAPDGKRFVVVMRTSSKSSNERLTHVNFLLNFADELQRKVPGGN